MADEVVQVCFVRHDDCGSLYYRCLLLKDCMSPAELWSVKTTPQKVYLDNTEMICYKKHKL